MSSEIEFDWPKALRPVLAEARAGTLEPRELYPVEIKALCELVAGAPLSDSPREIAPGMTALRRAERRDEQRAMGSSERAAWYFVAKLGSGRVWQASLFSEWLYMDKLPQILAPRYIVRALTRCAADRGAR